MRTFTLNILGKDYEIQIEKLENKRFNVMVNGKQHDTSIEDKQDNSMLLAVDGGLFTIELDGEPASGKMNVIVNSRERVIESDNLFGVRGLSKTKSHALDSAAQYVSQERRMSSHPAVAMGGISAPMPGKVIYVKVKLGDEVKVGDVVVILEAMKMENEITSDREGKISEVKVKEGDSVDANDVLVVID